MEIRKAMEMLGGNYRQFLTYVIINSPSHDKLTALRLAALSEKLGAEGQSEIAAIALETSLDNIHRETDSQVNELRYMAVQILTKHKWSSASAHVIRHFYLVQDEYLLDAAPKTVFLEAISCLGAMGTFECAQILALQLGYYNSRAEHSGEFDAETILAIIGALGETGDKSAFDYLFYITYLNYPEQIKAAAREALDRLRW